MTKILITGRGGFVASHLAELVKETTNWEILWNARNGQPDYVVHLGARTGIEESRHNPDDFLDQNVMGTLDLLNELERHFDEVKQFIYFSTDEVFGPMVNGKRFKEWDRHNPQNPYAASKAAAGDLCLAFAASYGLPTIITHSMNLIGERQPAKKFLPTVLRCAINEETLELHTDEKGHFGYRDYLHAKDAADAVLFLLKGERVKRDKFNIARYEALSPLYFIKYVEKILRTKIKVERIVHGTQFSGLDGSKLHALGWQPPVSFEERLRSTIEWMLQTKNRKWWEGK